MAPRAEPSQAVHLGWCLARLVLGGGRTRTEPTPCSRFGYALVGSARRAISGWEQKHRTLHLMAEGYTIREAVASMEISKLTAKRTRRSRKYGDIKCGVKK